jgi:hypothetical protein
VQNTQDTQLLSGDKSDDDMVEDDDESQDSKGEESPQKESPKKQTPSKRRKSQKASVIKLLESSKVFQSACSLMNFDEKTTLFETIEASKQAGQMSENMLYLLSTLLANTAQVTKHKIRSVNELPQNSVAVSENLFFTSSESGAEIVSFEGKVPLKIPEILPKKFREVIVILDLNDDEEEPKEKKKKVLKVCRVKFDRNLSNIMDVFPYNNEQWLTEAINYTVEFGTPLIID